MSTVLQFGPVDHGRVVTDEEAESGSFEEGYKYEVIDGRLYVSPTAEQPHDWFERDIHGNLTGYSRLRPDIIDVVTAGARVFVPGRRRTTAPEPDIAAYRDGPKKRRDRWRNFSPLLVVEILAGDTAEKDLVRNVDLYFCVPTIEEYWIIDARDPALPTMIVHRRTPGGWDVRHVATGEEYTTPLLPGFSYTLTAEAE